MALCSVVEYIKVFLCSRQTSQVFVSKNLKALHIRKLETFGAGPETLKSVHSTRLKQEIQHRIPGLTSQRRGVEVYLALADDLHSTKHAKPLVTKTLAS